VDTEVFSSRVAKVGILGAFGLAVGALVLYGLQALVWGNATTAPGPWLIGGSALVALALCGVRVVVSAAERVVWICASAAIAFWIMGQAAADAAGSAGSLQATLASLCGLLFFAGVGAGLALLARARMQPFRPSVLLDGLIVAMSIGAVGSIMTASLGGSATHHILPASVLLANLVVLAFAVWLSWVTGWHTGRTWNATVGALVASLPVSAYQFNGLGKEDPLVSAIVNVPWLVSMLLIALAAWQRPGLPIKAPSDAYGKLMIASGAAVVALTVLLADHFARLEMLTVVIAGATIAALIARATVAFKENSQILSASRHEALTDSLTALGNRRKLLIDLNRELVRASVSAPRVLVIFDLDGFKRYNDTYGHPAGDMLLQRLGGNLARAVGPYGYGYRLGGDEFCVLVTTGGSNAKTIISLTATALSENGDGFSVTSSHGAVMLPHEAREASLALRIADQRMYAQKEDRRSSATRQTRDFLMQVLQEREPELGEHMLDVARLARGVGARMALLAEELDEVVRAAELHDVGKMAVPDEILHKPAALDDEEWQFIRQHTIIGERILKAAPSLVPVAKLVRASHERWDGRGYPDRLAAEQIPLGARIVAACDAFDAMTTSRPYREAIDIDAALAELRSHAGSQFDPEIVEAVCDEVRASGYRLRHALMA
jgi:two-component system cell cycle response regulator